MVCVRLQVLGQARRASRPLASVSSIVEKAAVISLASPESFGYWMKSH